MSPFFTCFLFACGLLFFLRHIDRADLIVVMFDAHKLDISDELKMVIDTLKPHHDKMRCDQEEHQALRRSVTSRNRIADSGLSSVAVLMPCAFAGGQKSISLAGALLRLLLGEKVGMLEEPRSLKAHAQCGVASSFPNF